MERRERGEGRRGEGRKGEGGRGPPDDHDLVFVEKVQCHLSNLSPCHHHVASRFSHRLHMLQKRNMEHLTHTSSLSKTVSSSLAV